MTDNKPLSLVEKLQMIADAKLGDPMPSCLGDDPFNWGDPLSKLCGEAVKEIVRLQEFEWKYKALSK